MTVKIGYIGSANWVRSTCKVKFEINEPRKISIILMII